MTYSLHKSRGSALLSVSASIALASLLLFSSPSLADSDCSDFLRRELYDAAIDACTRELRDSDANRYTALINRGTAYQNTGKQAQALEDFNAAVALEPGRAKALVKRGVLLALQERFPEAVQDTVKAAEIEPSAATFMAVVEVYALQNKTDEACKWVRRVEESGNRPLTYITTEKAIRNIRASSCYSDIISGK